MRLGKVHEAPHVNAACLRHNGVTRPRQSTTEGTDGLETAF